MEKSKKVLILIYILAIGILSTGIFTKRVYGEINEEYAMKLVSNEVLKNTWNKSSYGLLGQPPEYLLVYNKDGTVDFNRSTLLDFYYNSIKTTYSYPFEIREEIYQNPQWSFGEVDLGKALKKSITTYSIEGTSQYDKDFNDVKPVEKGNIIIKKLDKKYKKWVREMEEKYKKMNTAYITEQAYDFFNSDLKDAIEDVGFTNVYDGVIRDKKFSNDAKGIENAYTAVVNRIKNFANEGKTPFFDELFDLISIELGTGAGYQNTNLYSLIKYKEGLEKQEEIMERIKEIYKKHLSHIYRTLGNNSNDINKNISELFETYILGEKDGKTVVKSFTTLNNADDYLIGGIKLNLSTLKYALENNKDDFVLSQRYGPFTFDFTPHSMTILYDGGDGDRIIFQMEDLGGTQIKDNKEFIRNFFTSVKNGTAEIIYLKQTYKNANPPSIFKGFDGSIRGPALFPYADFNNGFTNYGLPTLIIKYKEYDDYGTEGREIIRVLTLPDVHDQIYPFHLAGIPTKGYGPNVIERKLTLPQGWGLSGVGQDIYKNAVLEVDGQKIEGPGIETYLIIKNDSKGYVVDLVTMFNEDLIRVYEDVTLYSFLRNTDQISKKYKNLKETNKKTKVKPGA